MARIASPQAQTPTLRSQRMGLLTPGTRTEQTKLWEAGSGAITLDTVCDAGNTTDKGADFGGNLTVNSKIALFSNGQGSFGGTLQSGGNALNGTDAGVVLRGTTGMIHVTAPASNAALFHGFNRILRRQSLSLPMAELSSARSR